jgi:hypothetical protein
MKKPRVTATCLKVLAECDQYIRQYNVRGDRILHAASDVCDGRFTFDELTPLWRAGVLVPINDMPRSPRRMDRLEGICGGWSPRSCTVRFTDSGARHFWPRRINEGHGVGVDKEKTNG